ncbi:hypothetical protein A2619_04165 [candidate division WWE3 bacterium RIFOXYD1_FULL_39_9]|uniref:Glycosyltransferase RgtA/B/C/D-like domain-containing protein n=1 Tax=candidate division WWE3 bacterium RIFOXYD1_FULL_39_9 TaxID=1802649 RepID=A0A1F4X4J0_UNCKA|nr:MAG: hypothetical protein A2619_04165 [candidate division WWE3 bacterium RIFOXYD1_FULL_39_9]
MEKTKLNLRNLALPFVLYILVGIVGVLNLFYPTISSGFTKFQPDLVDSYFNAYVLEHGFKSFWDSGYSASFYSPTFFYPTKLLTTYSDNLLGTAPIYWVLRIFFDWVMSFELWEISVTVLTYFAFIVWLRYLKIRPSIAAICAYVFVFGISRVMQLNHPQLMPQLFTPLAFIFLTRFLLKPNLKDINIAALFIFLQTLAGYYIGWFLIFSLFFLILLSPIFLRAELKEVFQFISTNRRRVIITILFWIIAFLLFWSPYIFTSMSYRHFWKWELISNNLISWQSYFVVPESTLWYAFFGVLPTPIKEASDQFLFGGAFLFLAFAVCVVHLIKPSSQAFNFRLAGVFGAVGLLLLIITAKINEYTLWYLIYYGFPGTDGIRYVSRIWIVAYFYLFTCSAIVLNNYVENHLKLLSFKIFYILIFLFFITEQLVIHKPSVSKELAVVPESRLEEILKVNNDCDIFYNETDVGQKFYIAQHINAMWAAMNLNIPTINGYTGISKYNPGKKLNKDEIIKILGEHKDGQVCIFSSENGNYVLKEKF